MKKEPYFTPESIKDKAHEILGEISELRKQHPIKLSPDRCALLTIDMQRYFLDETSHAFTPAAKAIIPNVLELINTCTQKGMSVIYTRHINSESDAGMMAAWWNELIKPDSPASEIIREIGPLQGYVIKKKQYDAFYETNLEELLHDNGITQVIICGVTTHLCCETTARSAFVRGFEVFLAIDGTATFKESFHRATMINAAHGFAVPMLVSEILEHLNQDNDN